MREALVQTRTRYISLAGALLRRQGLRVASGGADGFIERVKKIGLSGQQLSEVGTLLAVLLHVNHQIEFMDSMLDRLAKGGISVRRFDVGKVMGGVLHAKYFIVDNESIFVGSQNFDWRSLEHIQELGLRLKNPDIARAFSAVYEQDWRLAAGEITQVEKKEAGHFPTRLASFGKGVPVFSPKGWLPDESLWDLPQLVKLIDSAQKMVRVQVLTYRSESRGEQFPDLENALKRAARRGAQVQLLVSNWSKRKGTIEGLQRLHDPPRLVVKLMNIPAWSGGFIPFARVVHAKYLVVDGKQGWVGTSNWERDYFYKSRNAGIIWQSDGLGLQLDQFFKDNWESTYAEAIDSKATYAPPRIGE